MLSATMKGVQRWLTGLGLARMVHRVHQFAFACYSILPSKAGVEHARCADVTYGIYVTRAAVPIGGRSAVGYVLMKLVMSLDNCGKKGPTAGLQHCNYCFILQCLW